MTTTNQIDNATIVRFAELEGHLGLRALEHEMLNGEYIVPSLGQPHMMQAWAECKVLGWVEFRDGGHWLTKAGADALQGHFDAVHHGMPVNERIVR